MTRVDQSAYIWVNDAPTERRGEHGFRYDLREWDRHRPGLQVSFRAYDRYQRVTFDPMTGDVEVHDLSDAIGEAQR